MEWAILFTPIYRNRITVDSRRNWLLSHHTFHIILVTINVGILLIAFSHGIHIETRWLELADFELTSDSSPLVIRHVLCWGGNNLLWRHFRSFAERRLAAYRKDLVHGLTHRWNVYDLGAILNTFEHLGYGFLSMLDQELLIDVGKHTGLKFDGRGVMRFKPLVGLLCREG